MWSLCWLLASLPWLTVWSPPGCSWQPVKQSRHKDAKIQRDSDTKIQSDSDRETKTQTHTADIHHYVLSQPPDILRSDENMRLQWSVWFDIMLKRLNMLYSCLYSFMGKYNCWNRRCSVYQSIFFCTLNIHTYFFISTYPSNVVLKPLSEKYMNNEGRIFYSPTTRMTVSRVHTLTAPSVLSERFSVPWEVIIKNVKNLISQCWRKSGMKKTVYSNWLINFQNSWRLI